MKSTLLGLLFAEIQGKFSLKKTILKLESRPFKDLDNFQKCLFLVDLEK